MGVGRGRCGSSHQRGIAWHWYLFECDTAVGIGSGKLGG